MSELQARLQNDLNVARKAQDKPLTLLLSTTLAEIKNRRIELMRDLTDEDVNEVLRRSIKKRRESIEMFANAGRHELAAKEGAEVSLLEKYLPAQMSDDDIRAVIQNALGPDVTAIGGLMSVIMPQLKGKAEGGRINAIAREEFARRG